MSFSRTSFYLHRRPHGEYYIGFYRGGRLRWKSSGCRTKVEAHNALVHLKEDWERQGSSPLLSKFVDDFLRFSAATHQPKTTQLFRTVLRPFQRFLTEMPLSEITAEHVDKFKAIRLGEVKAISVNVDLRILKSAFSTSRRWELVNSNPCQEVRLESVPDQAPLFLTSDDLNRLLAAIREKWFKNIVMFGVLTGMRRAEILNLLRSDVDIPGRRLHIQTGPTFKTKRGKRRTIPLSDQALSLLRSMPAGDSAYLVFTVSDERIASGRVTHMFEGYVREVGIDDRLRFHSRRHTFASWLVGQGTPIYEVQRLLGHSSAKVTEVYAHMGPQQLQQTVNRIQIGMN